MAATGEAKYALTAFVDSIPLEQQLCREITKPTSPGRKIAASLILERMASTGVVPSTTEPTDLRCFELTPILAEGLERLQKAGVRDPHPDILMELDLTDFSHSAVHLVTNPCDPEVSLTIETAGIVREPLDALVEMHRSY